MVDGLHVFDVIFHGQEFGEAEGAEEVTGGFLFGEEFGFELFKGRASSIFAGRFVFGVLMQDRESKNHCHA